MNTKTLEQLVNIDSPSGYTQEATQYIAEVLQGYGRSVKFTEKGAVTCNLGKNPEIVIAAHTDTLGGMVSKINADGTLRMSVVGGVLLPSFEGSYLRICTTEGKIYTGTLLLNNPATHANREAGTSKRSEANMHIRIDEAVNSIEDVEKLGISVGDFICFEPHYTETPSGFIKSKFMDNKAGCFVLFEIARLFQGKDVPVQLFFSNYEEVGHGAATGYAPTIKEMICIDMAVVGDVLTGSEQKCTICAKDSTGPYDYTMRQKLTQIAKTKKIDYTIDIYPYYGSDGSAALRAGNDFRVALIGMGVSASHGIERTHKQGIQATIDLCVAYVEEYSIK